MQGRGASPVWISTDGFTPNYFVAGAHTATTWTLIFDVNNAQSGVVPIPLYGPISEPVTVATQSATTVTLNMAFGGAGFFNNYTAPSGASVCISGNSNSAFNIWGITNMTTVDNNTLTYTVGTSASISGTGGTINVGTTANPTINGLGNYEIDCGALTTAVLGTTLAGNRLEGNGSANIKQNNCVMAPGEVFIQPNNPAQGFQGTRVSAQGFTPNPLGVNALNEWLVGGPQWNGGRYLVLGNNICGIDCFQGWGGNQQPHTFLSSRGDSAIGTYFDIGAPISGPGNGNLGGVFAHIGPFPVTPGGVHGVETQYDLFRLDTNSMSPGFVMRVHADTDIFEFGGNYLFNAGLAVSGLLKINISGTTAGILLPIYTIGTGGTGNLPLANTLSAGTTVMVSDSVSLTAGTCTGGGSNLMFAVTNGTAWTCH
jgi:hypothetical protein